MMRLRNRKLAFCFLAAAVALPGSGALAQTVKKPQDEAAAKKDPNVSLKALDTGSKAYSSGKLDVAVQSLTAALANGGLPPPKMAQAYYLRGMTYKKQKKPAQALSDLTVAVWVNGGLNESDRGTAMDARNQVYREAGLGDQAPPIANAVGTPSPGATAAAPPAAAPAAPAAAPVPPPVVAAPAPASPLERPPVAAAPVKAPSGRPVWQTEAGPAPPPVVHAELPVPPSSARVPVATGSGASGVSDAYSPPPAPPAASAGLTEPAAPPPQQQGSDMLAPIANAGSSISGFFSNMFGSGSAPPTTTGSTGAADGPGWVPADQVSRPHGPAAQVSASEPQRAPGYEVASATPTSASGFQTETKVAKSRASADNGKYRVQVASVRSREEADRLVQTLMSEHSAQLGGAEPHVDETVIGNMGTFYRVRVGPYGNASEPKKLCTTLKPQGFDCQILTN